MASILLLQSDPAVGRQLRKCIEDRPAWRVTGLVNTVSQGKRLLDESSPDLLLADLNLRDGPLSALLHEWRSLRRDRRTHLLVSTLSADDERLMPALRLGADAYFVHGATCDALSCTIRQVLAGGSPMSPAIARNLRAHFNAAGWKTLGTDDAAQAAFCLTPAESLMLNRLCEGYSNDEIARELRTSVQQLGLKKRGLYRKLRYDTRNLAEAGVAA